MSSINDQRTACFRGPRDYQDPAAIIRTAHAALDALGLPAEFVRPGDRVVLKPNWVKEHDERRPGPGQWEHVVTHPHVIEAVIRWVAPRLQGRGSITVCDAPQTDSSFATLRRYCDLDAMIERCRGDFPGARIELLDLRPEEWHAVDGVTVSKTILPGDPLGSTHVRLNADSEFVGYKGCGQLYGASFDMAETNARHSGVLHEYLLCRTPMDADVFINIPKLKTHKKVGITCALKNLVGINANKNWLPHHTEGTPDRGGDQFPAATTKAKLEHSWMGAAKRIVKGNALLSRLFVPMKKLARVYFGDTQKVVRSGNWHGNDTCWRMVLDLNKCLFSCQGDGEPRRRPLRYLAVVDGIIGGEGNGPMAPDPKPAGVIIAGSHPLAVDCVAATMMGFDWSRLRMLRGAFAMSRKSFVSFASDAIEVCSNEPAWHGPLKSIKETFAFRPHFGWTGAIETRPPQGASDRAA
ncbi:MAG: DUF362 domain-containing protein [Verrucomicrobia bacterium]|nr:DUF362 domain-containing protein [Verrucomicrobiota bacterium]MBI3867529.1 DUF362 domain-containing protein [Verrucomicrobiota bacterium]